MINRESRNQARAVSLTLPFSIFYGFRYGFDTLTYFFIVISILAIYMDVSYSRQINKDKKLLKEIWQDLPRL